MQFRFLLLLVLGHLIGDFMLQPKYILDKRKSKSIRDIMWGNFLHAIIHVVIIAVLLGLYLLCDKSLVFPQYATLSILIVLLHLCIDTVKSMLIRWRSSFEDNIFIFLLDQALHISTLLLVAFQFNLDSILVNIASSIKSYPYKIDILDKYLILVIISLVSTCGAGIFIKILIRHINFRNNRKFTKKVKLIVKSSNKIIRNNKNLEKKGILIVKSSNKDIGINNGGYIIGILERIMILLGILISQPAIIGFVLAAKSIARFKKLDDIEFAEYFIIGTLTSFIFAIIGGIFIYSLKVIPLVK